jgi:hypothetical protein
LIKHLLSVSAIPAGKLSSQYVNDVIFQQRLIEQVFKSYHLVEKRFFALDAIRKNWLSVK